MYKVAMYNTIKTLLEHGKSLREISRELGMCRKTVSRINMYCFDRGLRKLVTAELEKIEVAIRAKMIYILSHQYGPFWYSAPNLFESLQLHLRGHLIESTPFLYTHKEL